MNLVKLLATFLCVILTVGMNASSLTVTNGWTDNLRKEVILRCQGSSLCSRLCQQQEQCRVPEKICRDCIGRGLYLTYVMEEMGRTITRTNKMIDVDEVAKTLKKGQFISLSAKSVYNLIDRFHSQTVQKQFASLCPGDNRAMPLVFFTRKNSGELGEPHFVACGDGFYQLVKRAALKRFVTGP